MKQGFRAVLWFSLSLSTVFGNEPKQSVAVLVQIYETDTSSALQLLDVADDQQALSRAHAWQKEGRAALVESVYVRSISGDRLRIQSVLERIFGTEGDPPEAPNEVTLVNAKPPFLEPTDSTFTAFETDYEGIRIEIDPVAGDGEGNLIESYSTILWSALKEKVSLAANSQAREQKPLADKWLPIFTVTDLTDFLSSRQSGEAVLLHAARSPLNRDQTAIIFVTAWIQK
jgi:hypothetical protein